MDNGRARPRPRLRPRGRRCLLCEFAHVNGPALVRYPRDSVSQPESVDVDITVEIGTALQVREGKAAAILVFGSLFNIAESIAEELDLSLVNMRFIKPLDEDMIRKMAANHERLITLEDASIIGGAGSAVLEYLNLENIQIPVLRLGLSDEFPTQGSREQVLEDYQLDPENLLNSIKKYIE